jgi:hypothetical protein
MHFENDFYKENTKAIDVQKIIFKIWENKKNPELIKSLAELMRLKMAINVNYLRFSVLIYDFLFLVLASIVMKKVSSLTLSFIFLNFLI